MPQLRHHFATAGVLLTSGVLVVTVCVWALDDAGQDVTSFTEHRHPPVIVLGILVAATLVPLGVLALSREILSAVGLTLAGSAALLPLWAAWPDLDARWRALALAAGPLSAAGLALMARSRLGASLAAGAALLHALAYDPFRDLGCARVCLEVPPVLTMPTVRLTFLVAAGLTLAAGFAVGSALRHGGTTLFAAAGTVVLATMAVVRWRTTGDPDAYAALLLAAAPVPGLVSLPDVVAWTRVARRRSAVRRLALHLAEDPDGLLELGETIDSSLLSPGQQLALHNAQLAAETRARLVEVQASQRRVVAAADAERRRIERDLHDGTQQRLVGVLIQLSGRGLHEVEQQIRAVLADLRTFSRSTFPPVLEEEGLQVALAELAETSDAELDLDLQLTRPVAPDHARAVYALVSLAPPGAIVGVTLVSRDGGLEITMVGMKGVDLEAVRDRFGALGGALEAHDETVEGNLPCAW